MFEAVARSPLGASRENNFAQVYRAQAVGLNVSACAHILGVSAPSRSPLTVEEAAGDE